MASDGRRRADEEDVTGGIRSRGRWAAPRGRYRDGVRVRRRPFRARARPGGGVSQFQLFWISEATSPASFPPT